MDGARKKNIILIHLETQYAKTLQKRNLHEKLGKENLAGGEKSTRKSTVNGQRSTTGQCQRSTAEDDVEMMLADQWILTQLGLTWHRVEASQNL